MLSTLFEYNTVQEILINKQESVSVTLNIAAISVMIPYKRSIPSMWV